MLTFIPRVRPAPGYAEYPSAPAGIPRNPSFTEISSLLRSRLGVPQGVCCIDGILAGALDWPGVSFSAQRDAILTGAGAFEASGMAYVRVHGPGAAALLDACTPRDLSRLPVGGLAFVVFTTPEGTVDDEALLLRLSAEEFVASCGSCHVPRFLEAAASDVPEAQVERASLASFNVKGPRRLDAVATLLADPAAIQGLEPFRHLQSTTRAGHPVTLARTRIGVEVWGDTEALVWCWAAMLEAPTCFTPCGWNALHAYRLDCEAIEFLLYPLDLHRGTDLRSVGLGWMAREAKTADYVGRTVLTQSRRPDQRLVRVVASTVEVLPTTGAPLLNSEGHIVGQVTSSAVGLRTGRPTAFALVDSREPGRWNTADGALWSTESAREVAPAPSLSTPHPRG